MDRKLNSRRVKAYIMALAVLGSSTTCAGELLINRGGYSSIVASAAVGDGTGTYEDPFIFDENGTIVRNINDNKFYQVPTEGDALTVITSNGYPFANAVSFFGCKKSYRC